MYSKRSPNTVSIPFRMDQMSKARIAWIKAHAHGIRPSGSMVMRRALTFYLQHLENILDDHEEYDRELIYLKASADGDDMPWRTLPDFASQPGRKLSDWTREASRRRLDRFFESDPFGHKVRSQEASR